MQFVSFQSGLNVEFLMLSFAPSFHKGGLFYKCEV